MSTYVMSDIHGCYDKFLRMLAKISFSGTDLLILAGDYIDKGKYSLEMLKWMEHAPGNVRFVRGNHEEEFAAYVDFMCLIDRKGNLGTDFTSNKESMALYKTVRSFIRNNGFPFTYFDLYGTIGNLLDNAGVTLDDLCRWAGMVRRMPCYYELKVGSRACIVVHAGYAENLEDIRPEFDSLDQFYLCAREESCRLGGRRHAVIVAGHTPTIAEGSFSYNAGNVFRYYDKSKDCIFYDIDCGCVFRGRFPGAKLACLRLEDEKIFYLG